MAFPESSILDNFDRSDTGPPLGGNWTELGTAYEGFKISSNVCAIDTASQFIGEYWNVGNFGPDCECYATISTKVDWSYANIYVRLTGEDTADLDGYHAEARHEEGKLRIYRLDDGVDTQLGAEISQTIASDDDWGVEIVGSTLTFYYNDGGAGWGSVGTRTDATYSAAGKIGLGIWAMSTSPTLDDFGGGTINEKLPDKIKIIRSNQIPIHQLQL